jgi:superfamily II DNA or RNA helicase
MEVVRMDAETVRVHPVDEATVRLELDSGVGMELQERLTFLVPGHRHMPKFKHGAWDGKIRMYSPWKGTLARGLVPEVKQFCDKRGYRFECPREVWHCEPVPDAHHGRTRAFMQEISQWEPWDHQLDSIARLTWNRRNLLLSPTSSGKSLIIFGCCSWANRETGKPSLVIVPTKSLVRQMEGDFRDYAARDFKSQQIMGGETKVIDPKTDFVFSTWQSIYKLGREWFDQFGAIVGDEAHHFNADCVKSIMESAVGVKYRWGTTATIDEDECSVLSLRGLFGDVVKFVTLRELMDAGIVARLRIRVVILKYAPETARALRKAAEKAAADAKTDQKKQSARYETEMDFVLGHRGRMDFCVEFPGSLKGNSISMFRQIEKYGKPLAARMQEKYGADFHFVYGGTDVDDREAIRKLVDAPRDSYLRIGASTGVFSTGVSMKDLRHLLSVTPMKDKKKLLQAIGRILRLTPGKVHGTFWDLADDLRVGKHENYGWRHLQERLRAYDEQGLDVEFVEYPVE